MQYVDRGCSNPTKSGVQAALKFKEVVGSGVAPRRRGIGHDDEEKRTVKLQFRIEGNGEGNGFHVGVDCSDMGLDCEGLIDDDTKVGSLIGSSMVDVEKENRGRSDVVCTAKESDLTLLRNISSHMQQKICRGYQGERGVMNAGIRNCANGQGQLSRQHKEHL